MRFTKNLGNCNQVLCGPVTMEVRKDIIYLRYVKAYMEYDCTNGLKRPVP